jgi:hypothetical protein
MANNKKTGESDALAIEKERQKTKRYFMFLVIFALIAVIGIFIVFSGHESGGTRKVDLDLAKGKLTFSVDKPIVEQVKLPTESYTTQGSTVPFTTGTVDKAVIQQLNEVEPIQPTQFSGQNFINEEAGFLLTVENPAFWQVSYDPQGLDDPFFPVNTIYTSDGSHLNVNIEWLEPGTGLQTYVEQGLQQLIYSGVLAQLPQVDYDYASQTAFLYYVNPYTGGETYQKVVLNGNQVYIATANYNSLLSDPQRVQELITMVATFTLIAA